MIPSQTLIDFPVFSDNGTKQKPDDAKYAEGFAAADVLPFQWVNYFFNKASSAVTESNKGIASMEQELNAVVVAGGATPSEGTNNQVLSAIRYLIGQAKSEAILAAHPVGSLYWSESDTDPGTLFGGTWVQIKDKFVLAAGDTYTAGATGGASSVTLTTAMLPSHSHTLNSGNTSTTGTKTTAGLRGVSATSGAGTAHSHGENLALISDQTLSYVTTASYTGGGISGATINPSAASATVIAKVSNRYRVNTDTESAHFHSVTAKGYLYGSTDNTGSGSSINIMNPYIVQYCFKRTS